MNFGKKWLPQLGLIFLVLCSGILLRLGVISVLQFSWPPGTDYFIYYEMAVNSAAGHGAVLDFIYSYLRFPPQITHLADYYEPFYGFLCGLFLSPGASYRDSLWFPFLCGVLHLPTVFAFTFYLARSVFRQVSQVAFQSALLAMTCLALHPLFIQRSASLMKESVVSEAYLLLALCVLWGWHKKGAAMCFAALSVGLGVLQYESLPILFLTHLLVFGFQRRWFDLVLFISSFMLAVGAYWGWFYTQTGLWFSTKFYFLVSTYDGASFDKPRPFLWGAFLRKFSRSFLYLVRRTLQVLGVPFLSMLGVGLLAGWKRTHSMADRGFLLWMLSFLSSYLFIHAIAVDLRPQDYMVIWVLGMPWLACLAGSWGRGDLKKSRAHTYFQRVEVFLPLFLLCYAFCFAGLNATGVVMNYFFYPLWSPVHTLPAALAIALMLGLRQSIKARWSRRIYTYSVIWWLPLLLYTFSFGLSFDKIYDNTQQEKLLQYQGLKYFLDRYVDKDAVFLVSDPYAGHYFTGRPTLKLTESRWLQQYNPQFAVGLSAEALSEKGFESELLYRIQKLEIRRVSFLNSIVLPDETSGL